MNKRMGLPLAVIGMIAGMLCPANARNGPEPAGLGLRQASADKAWHQPTWGEAALPQVSIRLVSDVTPPRRLEGSELHALLRGNTLQIQSAGDRTGQNRRSLYFSDDGRLFELLRGRVAETGAWRTVNGQLCFFNPSMQPLTCLAGFHDARHKIQFIDLTNGRRQDMIVLQIGNALVPGDRGQSSGPSAQTPRWPSADLRRVAIEGLTDFVTRIRGSFKGLGRPGAEDVAAQSCRREKTAFACLVKAASIVDRRGSDADLVDYLSAAFGLNDQRVSRNQVAPLLVYAYIAPMHGNPDEAKARAWIARLAQTGVDGEDAAHVLLELADSAAVPRVAPWTGNAAASPTPWPSAELRQMAEADMGRFAALIKSDRTDKDEEWFQEYVKDKCVISGEAAGCLYLVGRLLLSHGSDEAIKDYLQRAAKLNYDMEDVASLGADIAIAPHNSVPNEHEARDWLRRLQGGDAASKAKAALYLRYFSS